MPDLSLSPTPGREVARALYGKFGSRMTEHEFEIEVARALASSPVPPAGLSELADNLERDRKEPDKVLCYVQDIRRLARFCVWHKGRAIAFLPGEAAYPGNGLFISSKSPCP